MRCLLGGAHDGQAFGYERWQRIMKDSNNSSICMHLSFDANGISKFACLTFQFKVFSFAPPGL